MAGNGTRPRVGVTKPAMILSSVVLPHPLGPSSASTSAGRIAMVTSSMTIAVP